MSNDPYIALLAQRDELEDEDEELLFEQYKASSCVKSTTPLEFTNNTAGAADYELRNF